MKQSIKNMSKNYLYTLFLSFLIALLFGSCAESRLMFLQVPVDSLEKTEYTKQGLDYRIKKQDILSINLSSTNSELQNLLNMYNSNYNNRGGGNINSTENFYFSGYTVNDTGFVFMPILGHYKVMGQTVLDVEKTLQKRADEVLKGAEVKVRLVSYKITFLGEVSAPGVRYFYQNEINILDGISYAGGLTQYANSKRILILRPTDIGWKTIKVDITQRSILETPDFYLLPNDMVYVEPIRSKFVKMNITEFFYWTTTLTTLLTTLVLLSK
jgi:polysaccharide biosynthesis/export protein